MSGPAAPYSIFSSTANLVLHFIPAPGANNADFDTAIRLGFASPGRIFGAAVGEQEPRRT